MDVSEQTGLSAGLTAQEEEYYETCLPSFSKVLL